MTNTSKILERVEIAVCDGCPDDLKELVQEYWDFDSNYNFKNRPTDIRKKYSALRVNIQVVVTKFSCISLYLNCDFCGTTERNKFSTQTPVKKCMDELHKCQNQYKCNHCQVKESEQIQNQIAIEAKVLADTEYKKSVEIYGKLNEAFKNERWNDLPLFLNMVLKNAIVINSLVELKKYYYGMGVYYYDMLIPVLRLLEAEHLVYLTYENQKQDKIKSYFILDKLRKEFYYQPNKQEIKRFSTRHRLNNIPKELKKQIETQIKKYK